MALVQNPILRGFNPDPSILRVNEDYYIAVSTFEWFPGVLIYHSKDLVNWELVATPLNNTNLLDMKGNPSSGGIWAPCLSYSDGLFYLIYTDVKNWTGAFKDSHNYLITATDVKGTWSEPVYMNSSGFDPSLFHDDDGKKWFVNMKWNYKVGVHPFDGIILQEYSPEKKKLVGPIKEIFRGTEIQLTEGPHLYKRNGYYYLLTAEGGTGYRHSVTLARSKNIEGPYELHPQNPILTSWSNPDLPIQKAGHASFCEGHDGYTYLVHLGGRGLKDTEALRRLKESGKTIDSKEIRGICPLGRETSIQRFIWKEDGWLYNVSGKNEPEEFIEFEGVVQKSKEKDIMATFDLDKLPLNFQSLRIPMEKFASLTDRKGYLRLYGKESISSKFTQALVARRQQSFKYLAETALEFSPNNLQQMAGLIIKYNEDNQFYLRVSFDEKLGKRTLGILKVDNGDFDMPMGENEVIIPEKAKEVFLRAMVNNDQLRFSYSFDGLEYIEIDLNFDASILSDEFANPMGFTGAFAGMACQDMSGQNLPCDFRFFRYKELD